MIWIWGSGRTSGHSHPLVYGNFRWRATDAKCCVNRFSEQINDAIKNVFCTYLRTLLLIFFLRIIVLKSPVLYCLYEENVRLIYSMNSTDLGVDYPKVNVRFNWAWCWDNEHELTSCFKKDHFFYLAPRLWGKKTKEKKCVHPLKVTSFVLFIPSRVGAVGAKYICSTKNRRWENAPFGNHYYICFQWHKEKVRTYK